MNSFHEQASELISKFCLSTKVCHQVIKSEKLAQVLEMVLITGNLMNEGTRSGGAAGFKFESLLTLTQTKSADGKLTVLDYIVMTFIAKNQRDVLDLASEFPDSQTTSRMFITDMIGEVRTMHQDLKACETELKNMKQDQSEKKMNKSSESSSASATNTKSDEGCDSSIEKKCIERTACNAAPTNPMEALLSAIKNRNGASKEKKPSIAANVEFSPGVNRLQMFLQGAKKEMSQLDSVRDQALNANRDMARYFGEGDDEKASAKILSILIKFVSGLTEALKKHDARKKAELQKEANEKKKEEKEKQLLMKNKAKNVCSKSICSGQVRIDCSNEIVEARLKHSRKQEHVKSHKPSSSATQARTCTKKSNSPLNISVQVGKENKTRNKVRDNPRWRNPQYIGKIDVAETKTVAKLPENQAKTTDSNISVGKKTARSSNNDTGRSLSSTSSLKRKQIGVENPCSNKPQIIKKNETTNTESKNTRTMDGGESVVRTTTVFQNPRASPTQQSSNHGTDNSDEDYIDVVENWRKHRSKRLGDFRSKLASAKGSFRKNNNKNQHD